MASQQYSLRWNNYVRHMTSAFESLRSDKDLIDVTLSCEGKKIPAHKMLLSACSSYFKDLFKENPCQHPVIIFRNVTHDDLMALVDFMYNGEVNVEQEQLASFLHTAELLQVQGLTNSNKDSETKTKKTAKQQDDRVPAPEVQFDEDGHPSPYQSDERTSTPTRTGPPAAAKKRKWQSPSRTASPAEVQAIAQVSAGANSGGEGEEGESHQMDEVPLKTEPDYDDDDDEQASGADDAVEEQESIIAKIQKSDQLILTTSTSRSRASNSDHSLFGGNVMDMLSTSESGDMSNFVMAGPSNESMGQEGIQDTRVKQMQMQLSNNEIALDEGEICEIVDYFSVPNMAGSEGEECQAEILKRLVRIENRQKDMLRALSHLNRSFKKQANASETVEISPSPKVVFTPEKSEESLLSEFFPINNDAEKDAFEMKLDNEDFVVTIHNALSRKLDDCDERAAVFEVMKAVMTQDYGSKYSRDGLRKNKIPFKSLGLYQLVKQTVLGCKNLAVVPSERAVDKWIGRWLTLCKPIAKIEHETL
ncbi:protein tramtrack, alpha isoform-like isoform X4 [Cloeon dipterum]|uniref:protein tramtrack, alpha isoform-like isoform X4 n=1 Tax=Cloeon dipterum TaxID=197152 RepID=UPI00321F7BF1